jgi:hypothetical protein
MNEIVKLVRCSCVLDVIDDSFQSVDPESTRSQLLIKCQVDDSLENGDYGSELVCVRDDLGHGSIDAEMEAQLNLEHFDVISNVFDHFIQLV